MSVAGILVLQIPKVQTFIADKVMTGISEKLDGTISIEKVHFKPFTTLVLKNVLITDDSPVKDPVDTTLKQIDTFFTARYIIAKFTLDGLIRQQSIHLDRAFVGGARMNLVLEDNTDSTSYKRVTENLSRIFRIKKNPDKNKNDKEIFYIRNVEIHDMVFTLNNRKTRKTPYHGGINWDDLEVTDINIKARNLRFKGGVMDGVMSSLSFTEKSGYHCKEISGSVKAGNGRTTISDLSIYDPWSRVELPLFMMSYANSRSFIKFTELVRLDAEISDSHLDFRTLEHFVPQFKDKELAFKVNGKVSGYVNDLHLSDFNLVSDRDIFRGKLSGRISGLPDIDMMKFEARAEGFEMNTEGLSRFLGEWMTDGGPDLGRYAKDVTFRMNADIKGRLSDLNVKTRLNSGIGGLAAGLRIKDMTARGKPMIISGTFSTDGLDIGRIIGNDLIAQTTMKAGVRAKMAERFSDSEFEIDSLIVNRMMLNGYDYSGIAATGTLSGNSFDGRLICNDPNLNFLFQGIFALSPKTKDSLYQFYANIGHADLHALNIDKRGISKIRLQTNANFRRTDRGDILGKVDIGGIVLENSQGKHEIGDISLTSHTNDNKYRIKLNSGFADGSYTGSASVRDFIRDLGTVTLKREAPALFKDSTYVWKGNSYSLDFRCHNSMNLLAFAMPGLYIADSTAFNVQIDRNGEFTSTLTSPRVAFKDQYLKGISARMSNKGEDLSGELLCKEIKAATLTLSDNSFQIFADDNHIGAGYTYDNQGEMVNRGEVFIHGDLSRDEDGLDFGLNILPSALYLNSKEWRILPSEIDIVDGNEIDVRALEITSGEERIRMDGRISSTRKDTLTMSMERFDISVINSVTRENLGIRGAATGRIRLTSPLSSKGLLVDMICDSTFIAGEPLGTMNITSTWDEQFEQFHISAMNDLGGRSNINAYGKYTPRVRSIEADVVLDKFSLGYAEPFLSGIFNETGGTVSGQIHIDGPVSSPEISSTGTRLDDALLRVEYTNVPYYADGTFHIDREGVYFDNINIRDRYNGNGKVTGSIGWNNFSDIYFDTNIRVSDIEAINIQENSGDVIYGNLFASGNIGITGPVNSLLMSIDAVTTKSGQMHIPLSGLAATGKETDLLQFKEIEKEVYVDPYEAMVTMLKKAEKSDSDFRVKMNVTASPDVEAFVEIDRSSGNVLSGRGSGTISLDVGNDIFNINGDYTLNSGSYKFVALGLASRDFTIQNGSSIRFNGDIMNSTLDIDAIYRTKASLSTLLSDTTSVANRRTVECGIKITDRISNPRLSFSIEIPDLDPMVKSRVESALSTEDKVQKQFLSLIISNNFLPDEQSGIFNNSSVLYSNVTEIMANQLNNILQKLDIPVDLGLSYQPNEKGNDIFDVAVSTQLFNNRVVVNGNIGNKQYSTSGTQNDVVGDLDIEIKLDRSGSFRLNIFSHSADQYTNYLDNSQRNGVGVMYQREFNSLRQFFRNIFSSRTKRIASRQAEEQAVIDGGKVEINIKGHENGQRKKGRNHER